jgi:hypothetical protein
VKAAPVAPAAVGRVGACGALVGSAAADAARERLIELPKERMNGRLLRRWGTRRRRCWTFGPTAFFDAASFRC